MKGFASKHSAYMTCSLKRSRSRPRSPGRKRQSVSGSIRTSKSSHSHGWAIAWGIMVFSLKLPMFAQRGQIATTSGPIRTQDMIIEQASYLNERVWVLHSFIDALEGGLERGGGTNVPPQVLPTCTLIRIDWITSQTFSPELLPQLLHLLHLLHLHFHGRLVHVRPLFLFPIPGLTHKFSELFPINLHLHHKLVRPLLQLLPVLLVQMDLQRVVSRVSGFNFLHAAEFAVVSGLLTSSNNHKVTHQELSRVNFTISWILLYTTIWNGLLSVHVYKETVCSQCTSRNRK